MQNAARRLILAYALTNAILYSGLMPLWEGFDELYHYGIVQHYSHTLAPTKIGLTKVPKQLYDSLDYAPVSRYIQPYLQRPSTSFEEYFALSPEERATRRVNMDRIPAAAVLEPSPRDDYEAMQSPLTYILLAPVERAFSPVPISTRVFLLRALLSISAVALLWIGTRKLLTALQVAPAFQTAGLLMLFSCQILYATICRMGNDALTLAWLPLFLVGLIAYWKRPSLKGAVLISVWMSIGLLIKASLLVFVPLAFVPLLLKRRQHAALSAAVLAFLAGPWFARNEILYGSLSANVEATRGVGAAVVLHAVTTLPWLKTAGEIIHAGMWTGNNSFTTFSSTTIDLTVLTLVAGWALYLRRTRREAPEQITIAATALALIGLIAATLFFFSSTNGAIVAPMPWYTPIFWIPVIAIATLGFSREPKIGKWLAAVAALLWIYVMAATWLAKLVPLYGGFRATHARFGELWRWYLEQSATRDSILSGLSPAPLGLIYFLLSLSLLLSVVATIETLRELFRTTLPGALALGPDERREGRAPGTRRN